MHSSLLSPYCLFFLRIFPIKSLFSSLINLHSHHFHFFTVSDAPILNFSFLFFLYSVLLPNWVKIRFSYFCCFWFFFLISFVVFRTSGIQTGELPPCRMMKGRRRSWISLLLKSSPNTKLQLRSLTVCSSLYHWFFFQILYGFLLVHRLDA